MLIFVEVGHYILTKWCVSYLKLIRADGQYAGAAHETKAMRNNALLSHNATAVAAAASGTNTHQHLQLHQNLHVTPPPAFSLVNGGRTCSDNANSNNMISNSAVASTAMLGVWPQGFCLPPTTTAAAAMSPESMGLRIGVNLPVDIAMGIGAGTGAGLLGEAGINNDVFNSMGLRQQQQQQLPLQQGLLGHLPGVETVAKAALEAVAMSAQTPIPACPTGVTGVWGEGGGGSLSGSVSSSSGGGGGGVKGGKTDARGRARSPGGGRDSSSRGSSQDLDASELKRQERNAREQRR